MKRTQQVAILIAFIGGSITCSSIAFGQCKAAVVNFQGVPGFIDDETLREKFDARAREWTSKMDDVRLEINKTQRKLNGRSARFPEETIAVLNKRLREKNEELTRMTRDSAKDVNNYRESLLASNRHTLDIAKEIAAERGITTVLDSSAATTSVPAAVSADCDITSELKARIQALSDNPKLAK